MICKISPEKIYLLMNKPSNYVCSSVSDSHKTVYDLLSLELKNLLQAKRGEKIHTVGRLDCDTTGLLIFTTDGFFSNFITRNENKIPKTYLVELENSVSKINQFFYKDKLKTGIILPAEKKSSEEFVDNAIINFLTKTKCEVTITQGKFHQIKRMFLALENKVINLKRIAIGNLKLDENLNFGDYRVLTKEEFYKIINFRTNFDNQFILL